MCLAYIVCLVLHLHQGATNDGEAWLEGDVVDEPEEQHDEGHTLQQLVQDLQGRGGRAVVGRGGQWGRC